MQKKRGISYLLFRLFRGLVWLVYPKTTVEGLENLPKEPCVVVGNHSHMNGPICGELYFPGKCVTWCAYQMMYLKEVPNYSFQDFWKGKPKWTRGFYRVLSYLIAPIAVVLFRNAKTIPVFYDNRLLTTFRQTISALKENTNVIIFPEDYEPYNHIVYHFRDKFINVAKQYYKQTGKALPFVPLYLAPNLKKMYLGKPVAFNPDAPIEEERQRICRYLMDEITRIAVNLPKHRVVPYPNMPKKNYPYNTSDEVMENAKTRC